MTKDTLTRIRQVVSRKLAKRDRLEMAAIERIIALLEPAERRQSRAARPTRARTTRPRAAAAHRRRSAPREH
jgi:hypothetical protein